MNLDEVMIKLKQGNVNALETIYNEMHVALFAFSLSIVNNNDIASDIVQDAFLQIYHKASTYMDYTNAKAWIYKIVRNLSIDYIRKQKRYIRFVEQSDIDITSKDNTIDDYATYELLNDLDDISKQIVLLYVFEGFKHFEIANILNMKEGTVRWKYREALKILEKKTRGDDCG